MKLWLNAYFSPSALFVVSQIITIWLIYGEGDMSAETGH